MDQLEHDYPDLLLGAYPAPCLSVYQATHRQFPDRQQDPIRFRNLIRSLEAGLQQKYPDRDADALLARFRALAADAEFWEHNLEGLAVLAAPGMFRVYRLPRPVPEVAVVGDSLHTRPLLRIVQSADRFQILGLDRHRARLFEGNRDRMQEIELAPQVPRTVDQVVTREVERDRASRTYGRIEPGAMGRHGASDVKQDAIDVETEQFFRQVDRAVLEYHSRATGLPLLLAALPEHQRLFRALSVNPQLIATAIDVNPEALTPEQLRERAWQLLKPWYLQRLAGMLKAFAAAQAAQHGSTDLSDVARTADEGRVATLLLEAGRRVPGRIDAAGAVAFAQPDAAADEDLLDVLGERVLRSGGEVLVVPAERMPGTSGLAAIYRY
ncbi:hypothetical protein [Cognatiluteimonas weifangensis]|uniref:Uncharacterized protein n=1 Tax=Cognatiluteimonas weifangensis TaxID=2303539 RepID=A0A372DMY2_9GAMM|nr:hypothetical protein [Luteimonas weifangensis]RFP60879.1 hypothetical protein D0Y53_07010 [Luteimonas weifangensis]